MELYPGDLVEIQGLKAEELNGQAGALWRLDEESGRWEVKLHGGDMKSIRPENLLFKAVGPVEDDGTLALVGMATEHPVIQRVLGRLQAENMKDMLATTQLVSHVLSPQGGGKAEGDDIPIWLKLGRQAEQKVRGSLEDLQRNLEEVDGIDPQTLTSKVAEEMRMARKDLVRFVQSAQERLEGVLGRLRPALRRLESSSAPQKKKHGWSAEDKDSMPLREKYRDSFGAPAGSVAKPTQQGKAKEKAAEEPLLKPIVVKFQGKGDNPPPSDNLYVKGLPGWVTEEDLREIFQDGEIQSMRMKTADWGAIAFIRLLNKSAATRAIAKHNNTVPESLLKKAAEWEKIRSEVEKAQAAFRAAVEQLEKGVMVVLDLALPVGLEFEQHSLVVKAAQPGSQAAEKGIARGWRARSLGGVDLKKGKSLFKRIEKLRSHGLHQAVLALSPPSLVISFDKRPMGISVERDEELGLFFVREAAAAARARGLRPGALLTAIDTQDVSSMQMEEVVELLREVILPVRLVFEQARAVGGASRRPDVSEEDAKAAAEILVEDSEDEAAAPAKPTPATVEVRVDLSKPLGTVFDDHAVAKEVKEGMQGSELGIRQGWRALTVGGEPVKTTQELASMFQELKGASILQVKVEFATPTDSAVAAPGAAVEVPSRAQKMVPKSVEMVFDDDELPKMVKLNVDLSQSLGIGFDDQLIVNVVNGGSQAAKFGVAKGWRALSVDDERVESSAALAARVQTLKRQGHKSTVIAFHALTAPGAQAAPCSQAAPDGVAAPSGPAAPSRPAQTRIALEAATNGVRELAVDLSQPLGMVVEDDLRVRSVTPGGQASNLGICQGWQVFSAGGEEVSTSKALVARIQAAKAQASKSLTLAFRSFPAKDGNPATGRQTVETTPTPRPAPAPPASPGCIDIKLDLSMPLGIGFSDTLIVKSVQAGTQASKLGVLQSWQARAVGGEAVATSKELVGKVQDAKARGVQSLTIAFLVSSSRAGPTGAGAEEEKPPASMASKRPAEEPLPPLEVRLDLSQPLGIGFDDNLLVKTIVAGSQAERLGICAGMLATSVGGEAISTSKALVGVVKAAKAAGVKNVPITFSGHSASMKRAALEAEPAEAAAAAQHGAEKRPMEDRATTEIRVDLSKPLGIGFDDGLIAKDVQASTQAYQLGVRAGWRASAVGGEAVRTTTELVEKLKGLKAKGAPSVEIAFELPGADGSDAAKKSRLS